MRILFDTNILIGALITKGTPPDGLYQGWLRGEFNLVTSAAQLAEIANVVIRPRLQKKPPASPGAEWPEKPVVTELRHDSGDTKLDTVGPAIKDDASETP